VILGAYGVAGTPMVRQLPPAELGDALAALEEAGVGTVWFGENVGDEAFATAGVLLARSARLVIAPGVANIAARSPVAMAAGRRILAAAHPGRFAIALGVSHGPIIAAYGGRPDGSPLERLARYLDAMTTAPGWSPDDGPVLVAALGPRMLELAAERRRGVHAWNVTAEHTAVARAAVGPSVQVAPRHAVLLCGDPVTARTVGRRHLAGYLDFPNYRRSWLRQGFAERDLAGGGSDRLVDAMVAWGSVEQVAARLAEVRAAGADHIAVHALVRPGCGAAGAAIEAANLLASGL
jgi:probable F420-dependent oxidoreductase